MGLGPSIEERYPPPRSPHGQPRPQRHPHQQQPHPTISVAEFLQRLEAKVNQSSTALENIQKKHGVNTKEARSSIIDLMKTTKHTIQAAKQQLQGPAADPPLPSEAHMQSLPTTLTTEQLMKQLKDILQHWTKTLSNVKTNTMGPKDLHQYIREEMRDTETKLERILNRVHATVPGGAGGAIVDHTNNPPAAPAGHDVDRLVAEKVALEHQLNEERSEWRVKMSRLQEENDKLMRNNTKLKSSYVDLKAEYDSVLSRLSKVMGEKLVANNPAIADLSDPNRPTKMAEVYGELYDNEWSDAYLGLEKGGYNEMQAIETLREILIDAVVFCQKKSDLIVTTTEKAVNQLFEEYQKSHKHKAIRKVHSQTMVSSKEDTAPASLERDRTFLEEVQMIKKWKPTDKSPASVSGGTKTVDGKMTMAANVNMTDQLVKLRKEMSLSLVPMVYKAYLKPRWDKECITELKPFIKKCLFVGWMMMVQSPRLVLVPPATGGASFDKNLYSAYTVSGSHVDFVVWPAMLLHEGGPILRKGIAQGKR